MRALLYDSFGGRLDVREVPAPLPSAAGVVVRVKASGDVPQQLVPLQAAGEALRRVGSTPGITVVTPR